MNAHDLRVEEAPAPYRVAPLLTDQLDSFASAPEGFKRLRELVLNLAVRGRLVPQEADDDTASELLKRIAREPEGVDAEGKVKRSKTQVLVDDDGQPFGVPNTWAWVRLGEIVEVLDSLRRPVTKGDRKAGPYPYYGASGIVDYVSDFLFDEDLVLVGEDGAKWDAGDQTAFAISGKTWVNNHAHVLRPNRTLLSDKYLIRALVALDLQPFITGTTVPKLNQAKLVSIGIPVPPLAEQSRIVAKVEELMALIDRLEAKVDAGETARGKLLDTLLAALADSPDAAATADAWAQLSPHFDLLLQTPADVDRLQQTVLQLAVKGRLVPQNPNDEPTAELLKRIRFEKARLVTEGKIKSEKPLPVIGEAEFTYEAPQHWEKVRLAELALELCTGPFGSALHKQDYISGGIPLINPSHLHKGMIQPETDVSVTRETSERLSSYRLSNGDIVLARRGEAGRCAIVTAKEEGWLCGTGSFFLKLPTMLNRDFVYLLFQCPDIRGYLSEGSVGTTMVNLNQRILIMMPIGLPPLAEQFRIVAAVASLTALCDRLRERLAARRALSAKLTTALTEAAIASSSCQS